MDKLKETEQFPRFKRDRKNLNDDIDELVKWVNRLKNWIEDIYEKLAKRTNWTLAIFGKSTWELIHPDNTGTDQNGNFKFEIDSSGNLIVQYKQSGTWTTFDTTNGPGTS